MWTPCCPELHEHNLPLDGVVGIPVAVDGLRPEIRRFFRHILRRHHRGEARTGDRDKQGSPRNHAHGGILSHQAAEISGQPKTVLATRTLARVPDTGVRVN